MLQVRSPKNMPKVILINPAMSTMGYSIITPRWLFVIAQATPVELVGDPVLVDESLHEFDPSIVRPEISWALASARAIAWRVTGH